MEIFSALNVFGSIDLTVMLLFYIYENSRPIYSVLFGITCIGSSAYGFLSGTWPFGVIELVWAVFSIKKFFTRNNKTLQNIS
ncbi:MAG: hypothetical protein M1468_03800 [Candidatus Thermoplasmatota archaeon]|jgi:hypothetical protein|nr:hypothetical protein [Candidatus Thermoplasmatota archaeon]MCL5441771.1 hypothetical protein [Candidatus Thermoplasmatota archaeon]